MHPGSCELVSDDAQFLDSLIALELGMTKAGLQCSQQDLCFGQFSLGLFATGAIRELLLGEAVAGLRRDLITASTNDADRHLAILHEPVPAGANLHVTAGLAPFTGLFALARLAVAGTLPEQAERQAHAGFRVLLAAILAARVLAIRDAELQRLLFGLLRRGAAARSVVAVKTIQ